MSRIPPLLQPCLELPVDESLLLFTSTIGATANWLLVRFLSHALSDCKTGSAHDGHSIVFVSWMRDYEFWKQEARKGAGLDLDRMKREGRLAFVDGLSELSVEALAQPNGGSSKMTLVEHHKTLSERPATQLLGTPSSRGLQSLPARGPPSGSVLPRPLASTVNPRQGTALTAATTATTPPTSVERNQAGHYVLKSPEIPNFIATLKAAVSALASSVSRKTIVILDNPDILLVLNSALTPATLISALLTIHTTPSVSHIVTHIQADDPLLSLSSPPQPLELAHHNFLVKYAHMSQRIIGVRVLDTGVAKDVSGVLRVTYQEDDLCSLKLKDEKQQHDAESTEGKEFLFQVRGDGSVRVFERGAGGDG